MSSFNIADVLDFLTSGAVFTREDGREARVLFITNTALPEKIQAQYPPQVVYADESDNVLSCDINRFLKNRTFYNVQPELESRLENLLAAGSTNSGSDVLDLMGDGDDDLTLTDDGDMDMTSLDAAIGSDDGSDDEDIDTQEPIVEFTLRHADTDLPEIFDLDHLTAAVTSYQQQPSPDLANVQHVLFIKADAGISDATLRAAFSPANEGLNHTLEFAVDTEGTGDMRLINWDTFVGVYPCVFYGSRMYQVVFGAQATNVAPEVIEEIAAKAAIEVMAAMDANAVTETVITAEDDEELIPYPRNAGASTDPIDDVAFTESAPAPAKVPAVPAPAVQVKIEVAPAAPANSAPTTAMAQALAAAKPQA